eukprot:TRINITY_DN15102_c0_g1_i2.p1 TRINITY_DN15102_c0_g1~~TRINITY_DN15102_c0_g1_i2.p1  ORF type:complete len:309 (+),score=89.14 TRINITY_DN15102_c0_g1_i2:52-978(+)
MTHGGQVLTGAEVEEVVVEDGRAVGVRMALDGRIIRCSVVVSAAGLRNTELMCPTFAQHAEAPALKNLRDSNSGALLYVGLEGDAAALGLDAHNYWIYPRHDYEAAATAFEALSWEDITDPEVHGDWDLPVLFVCSMSARDPAQKERPSLVVFCPMAFDRWHCYEGSAPARRSKEYTELKEALADKMWTTVLKYFPKLQGHASSLGAGTPLSCEAFLHAPRGGIYGLDAAPARFALSAQAALRPKTPVSGLYLTGQDVLSCGVGGALESGVLTASAVLHRNLTADLLDVAQTMNKRDRTAAKAAKKAV